MINNDVNHYIKKDNSVSKNKFILTKDKRTVDVLLKNDFVQLSKNGDTYVFINEFEKLMTFAQKEKLNFTFSNVLMF